MLYTYLKVQFYLKGPLVKLVVIFELTMIVYCAWNANRMGVLGLHYFLTPQFVIVKHLRLLGRQLENAISGFNRKRLANFADFENTEKISVAHKLCQTLSRFRTEHATILSQLVHINCNAASGFLFAAVISQLPINLWMVSSLLFKRQSRGEQAVMVALILIQLYLGMAARNVLVKLSGSLYNPTTIEHLSKMQILLKVIEKMPVKLEQQVFRFSLDYGTIVKAKLKLATYYELVHTNKQFCFTMGPLGELSKRGIFEVRETFNLNLTKKLFVVLHF